MGAGLLWAGCPRDNDSACAARRRACSADRPMLALFSDRRSCDGRLLERKCWTWQAPARRIFPRAAVRGRGTDGMRSRRSGGSWRTWT